MITINTVKHKVRNKLLKHKKSSEFLLVVTIFVIISVFFLFGLIISSGDVAQGDWGTPLTASAAINNLGSSLFVRAYNSVGVTHFDHWYFPYFQLLNALLSPLGFVGGAEIKVLSVFLVSICGITAYVLARFFHLSKMSSFLSGLFYMTTPIVFDWLIFGWRDYLIAYALFPLMILSSKKYIETNDLRYALVSGLILSIATTQPTFILIYPLFSLLFILFESKGNLGIIKRGLILTAISLTIWFLVYLSFFASYNNAESLSFYFVDYLYGVKAQFSNFISLINPMRLWGSTFNYQFETYFPKELIILSFIPVVIAMLAVFLKPSNKRVLFFTVSYLPVFLAYFVFHNMRYLVSNIPYGAIFEAPSIFLVPASLGLAILIGYTNQTIPVLFTKFKRVSSSHLFRNMSFVIILILIVLAGIPWWTGQISGDPISGPPHKLNLYEIPSGYTKWNNDLDMNNEYFILYLPLQANVQITDTAYFSNDYEGVNSGIFTLVNNLPYISISNSTLFLNELMNGSSSEIGERWGSFSIKYIVVYTNVQSAYNMSDILNLLSAQKGIVEVADLPSVVVFEDQYAKPVVYASNPDAEVEIVYHDPTLFKLQANSTGPFTVVFNQVYSSGWHAWVNGSVLPDAAHFKTADGFNGWQIDSSGSMTIDIYYEPQTTYLISKIIASVVLVVVSLYILVASLKGFRRKF